MDESFEKKLQDRRHKEIVEEMLRNGSYQQSGELKGEIKRGKRLDIVIGISGGGKSSALVNPISHYYHSLILDSDMIKEKLPHYDGGKGAGQVHEESKVLLQKAIQFAIYKEVNIVVPIVGKTLESITNIAETAKEYGYHCHLHLNEIPVELAIERAWKRYLKTGRYITEEYFHRVGNRPLENYEILKREYFENNLFDSFSRWNNEVAFGEKPILIEAYPEERGERKFMFSKEELEKIDEMSIADYVLNQGLHIKKTGKDYKIEELSGGCYIDIEKNQWKWWNRDRGGKIISFVMELEGKNWVEAVKTLLNMNLTPSERMIAAGAPKEKIPFLLPKSKKNINAHAPKRAFSYLVKTRNIDPEIVSELMKQGLIYEDGKSNVVFVGKDKDGKPRYAFLRGTYTDKRYMGEVYGSEKSYSFSIPGKNKTLYVFESAIDLLSYQTLLKKHNCIEELKDSHFLSLGGVSTPALDRYLKDYPIEKIVCCLDNDEAGKEATEKIAEQYGKDYIIKSHLPKAKDFNMQLTNEVEEELVQEESIERAEDMEIDI